MTRGISLLFIMIGISLIGASGTSRMPDTPEIAQQRARFQEMEAVALVPSPSVVADHADALSGASVTTPVPNPAPTHAERRSLSGGQLDPGGVYPSEPHETPEITLPAPDPDMPAPTHISIPAVGIDTDVVAVTSHVEFVTGQRVQMWQVADWAAGHHETSAAPGEGGNIVIAGHDDVRGEVFRGLHAIEMGDEVRVDSPAGSFFYSVQEIHLRREKDVALDERLAVGQFMAPMPEERLTLITCWPYGVDDHRLIVVAKPGASLPQ